MLRDGERGEIALRLVVVMGLVAGVIWAVPMVLFQRQAADYVGDVTEGAQDGPAATEGGGEAAPGPISQANDAMAQATMNDAIRVPQVYYAENGTFEGFSAQVAAQFAPTVNFTGGPPAPGVVSIRGLTATTVVLVTSLEPGGSLCAAAEGDLVTFGRTNASTSAQCTGGW